MNICASESIKQIMKRATFFLTPKKERTNYEVFIDFVVEFLAVLQACKRTGNGGEGFESSGK